VEKRKRGVLMDIHDKILNIVAKEIQIDTEEISLDSTMNDLYMDSLDTVDIILTIEDEFKIELLNEFSFDGNMTFGRFVNLVGDKLRESEGS
jgi:acyl carrier protein